MFRLRRNVLLSYLLSGYLAGVVRVIARSAKLGAHAVERAFRVAHLVHNLVLQHVHVKNRRLVFPKPNVLNCKFRLSLVKIFEILSGVIF